MKKSEFVKVIKQLMDEKTGRLSCGKIAVLDNDLKDDIVHFLVRHRYAIVLDFISPNIDWGWLRACGYLHQTTGKDFIFVHSVEHKIK